MSRRQFHFNFEKRVTARERLLYAHTRTYTVQQSAEEEEFKGLVAFFAIRLETLSVAKILLAEGYIAKLLLKCRVFTAVETCK